MFFLGNMAVPGGDAKELRKTYAEPLTDRVRRDHAKRCAGVRSVTLPHIPHRDGPATA